MVRNAQYFIGLCGMAYKLGVVRSLMTLLLEIYFSNCQ